MPCEKKEDKIIVDGQECRVFIRTNFMNRGDVEVFVQKDIGGFQTEWQLYSVNGELVEVPTVHEERPDIEYEERRAKIWKQYTKRHEEQKAKDIPAWMKEFCKEWNPLDETMEKIGGWADKILDWDNLPEELFEVEKQL